MFNFLLRRRIKQIRININSLIDSIEYKAKKKKRSSSLQEQNKLEEEMVAEEEVLKDYKNELDSRITKLYKKMFNCKLDGYKTEKVFMVYNPGGTSISGLKFKGLGFNKKYFNQEESKKLARKFGKIILMRPSEIVKIGDLGQEEERYNIIDFFPERV